MCTYDLHTFFRSLSLSLSLAKCMYSHLSLICILHQSFGHLQRHFWNRSSTYISTLLFFSSRNVLNISLHYFHVNYMQRDGHYAWMIPSHFFLCFFFFVFPFALQKHYSLEMYEPYCSCFVFVFVNTHLLTQGVGYHYQIRVYLRNNIQLFLYNIVVCCLTFETHKVKLNDSLLNWNHIHSTTTTNELRMELLIKDGRQNSECSNI